MRRFLRPGMLEEMEQLRAALLDLVDVGDDVSGEEFDKRIRQARELLAKDKQG